MPGTSSGRNILAQTGSMMESVSSSNRGCRPRRDLAAPGDAVAQAQGEDDRGRDDHREAEIHQPGHEGVGPASRS